MRCFQFGVRVVSAGFLLLKAAYLLNDARHPPTASPNPLAVLKSHGFPCLPQAPLAPGRPRTQHPIHLTLFSFPPLAAAHPDPLSFQPLAAAHPDPLLPCFAFFFCIYVPLQMLMLMVMYIRDGSSILFFPVSLFFCICVPLQVLMLTVMYIKDGSLRGGICFVANGCY
ncbi:hypothetical protein L7F22_057017 [Adiantum nelumboides]|nr:hypothetical protein [Adiantum nelumboides]